MSAGIALLSLLALAGGAGAACRFVVDGVVAARSQFRVPMGTLVINVLGSFLLGALTAWVIGGGESPGVLLVAGTGFLGGFTTFSTACVEVARLVLAGRQRAAAALTLTMLAASLLAAALGLIGGAGLARIVG